MMGKSSNTTGPHYEIESATASVPIIFCTARDTEEDMIAGLDVGADDYIMKPYSLKAVLARVRAVLRRTSASVATAGQHSDLVSYKGLVLCKEQNMYGRRLGG